MGLFRNQLFFWTLMLFVLVPVKVFCAYEVKEGVWPDNIIVAQKKNLEAILVEKDTQKLYFVQKQDSGLFKVLYELSCSTGKNLGDKKVEGDSKTPEGVYYVTGHYPGKYLSSVYGSRAFTLDYPNYKDKIEGRNGHNIWIHGTDKSPLTQRTTNGCVALANADIDKLKDMVKVGETPVLIAKKIDFMKKEQVEKEVGVKITDFFNNWIKSYKTGSYHDYLSFYSDEYLPKIGWWTSWTETRKSIDKLSVGYDSLSVFKEGPDVYTIWFDAILALEQESINLGKRQLFVRKEKDGFHIFGDFYFDKGKDLVASSLELKNKVYFEKDLHKFMDTWVTAWSGKNIKVYADCYSADFYSDGKSKKNWVRYKDRLNKKYDYIKVSVENISFVKQGEYVRASFYQVYESNAFKTSGMKTLVLKQEKGKWTILKEIWKKTG